MSLSLNEVEATAKKAARGAGYPWGLAEEAAKATRWLCARGVDGCGALAGVIEAVDGADLATWRPVPGTVWEATGGTMCPVCAGTAMADGLADLSAGDLRLGKVTAPALLVPFAAQCAQALGVVVSADWPGGNAVTDGKAVSVVGDLAGTTDEVTIRLGGTVAETTGCTRADPDPAVRRRLEVYAHRTYAPATEESRLKGAGAGLSDND